MDEAVVGQAPVAKDKAKASTSTIEDLKALVRLHDRTVNVETAREDVDAETGEFDAGEVLHESIWVGSLQATKDTRNLKRLGITSILTTARGLDVCPDRAFRHREVLMADHPAEDLLGKLDGCFDFLDEELAAERRVLVHCASGVSRSVSVCVAYLMVRRKMNLKSSLECVRRNRRFANPNVGFMIQLNELEANNGDLVQARASYQLKIKGKPITDSLAQWRLEANDIHYQVDDLENKIKACAAMSPILVEERMRILQRLAESAEALVTPSSCDNVSQLILKSAISKAARLQGSLKDFLPKAHSLE